MSRPKSNSLTRAQQRNLSLACANRAILTFASSVIRDESIVFDEDRKDVIRKITESQRERYQPLFQSPFDVAYWFWSTYFAGMIPYGDMPNDSKNRWLALLERLHDVQGHDVNLFERWIHNLRICPSTHTASREIWDNAHYGFYGNGKNRSHDRIFSFIYSCIRAGMATYRQIPERIVWDSLFYAWFGDYGMDLLSLRYTGKSFDEDALKVGMQNLPEFTLNEQDIAHLQAAAGAWISHNRDGFKSLREHLQKFEFVRFVVGRGWIDLGGLLQIERIPIVENNPKAESPTNVFSLAYWMDYKRWWQGDVHGHLPLRLLDEWRSVILRSRLEYILKHRFEYRWGDALEVWRELETRWTWDKDKGDIRSPGEKTLQVLRDFYHHKDMAGDLNKLPAGDSQVRRFVLKAWTLYVNEPNLLEDSSRIFLREAANAVLGYVRKKLRQPSGTEKESLYADSPHFPSQMILNENEDICHDALSVLAYLSPVSNFAERGWKVLAPILFLLRALRFPAVDRNLQWWIPNGAPDLDSEEESASESKETQLGSETYIWMSFYRVPMEFVRWFQRFATLMRDEDPGVVKLREHFAQFCLDRLKPQKAKKAGHPADQPDDQGQSVPEPVEPDVHWRRGYIEAIQALGVNPAGKGHRVLETVGASDPDETVRELAGEVVLDMIKATRLPKAKGRQAMLHAFWCLRKAHRRSLGLDVDDRGSQSTKDREIYRTTMED